MIHVERIFARRVHRTAWRTDYRDTSCRCVFYRSLVLISSVLPYVSTRIPAVEGSSATFRANITLPSVEHLTA